MLSLGRCRHQGQHHAGFCARPPRAPGWAFSKRPPVIKNHPFVDGNKRIGFAVAATFLEVNGRKLGATEADAVIQTLALAAGEIDEADYARWLDSCCA